MKFLAFIALAACCSLTSYSQSVLMGTALEEDRYSEIKKSPYLFKDFAPALVYDKKKNITDKYLLNYNGYTKEFEFLHEDKTYVLDVRYYDEIEIAEYTPSTSYSPKFVSESIRFIKGIDPKDRKNFQMLVHTNDNMTVFKNFDVKLTLSESTGSGKGIVKTELFLSNFSYYTIKGDAISKLKLNKKSVQQSLDGHPKIASYVKKNKMKLNSEQNLRQLLTYYSDVILPEDAISDPVASKKN